MAWFHALVEGRFRTGDVAIDYDARPFSLPAPAAARRQTAIAVAQAAAAEKGQEFFDGLLLRMRALDAGPPLRVGLQPTRWFDFIATNRDPTDRGPWEPAQFDDGRANPVTVTALIIASDGMMVLTQRSAALNQYPGYWTATVAGFAEPGDVLDDAPHPFASLVREIEEELGLAVRLEECELLCIGRPDDIKHAQWLFRVRVPLPAPVVIEAAQKSQEISQAVALPHTMSAFARFAEGKEWVPASRALIERSITLGS